MTNHLQNSSPWNQTYTISPIGFVESSLKEPGLVSDDEELHSDEDQADMRRQSREIKQLLSRIVVNPSLEGILEGLDKFSHALIIYWPHLAPDGSRNIMQVHPMGRRDLEKVGVFASCSPARPNPLLATAVKIVEVKDNIVSVQGLEAVHGSPVMDIKPYSRHYLQIKDLKMANWMETIDGEFNDEAVSG